MTKSTPLTVTTRPKRRMARAADPDLLLGAHVKVPSKLGTVQVLLLRSDGATLTELALATGWQAHSLRGAMAGALKKRGLIIVSSKLDGVRRYHASLPA